MVICLERGANLHTSQLMPLPLTVSCFSKIQIGFTFLVPAHPGSPGKGLLSARARARVCVCVCVCRRTHPPCSAIHLAMFSAKTKRTTKPTTFAKKPRMPRSTTVTAMR